MHCLSKFIPIRYRIHKAKEMLMHGDETITNIALKVGFNDSAYFSRVFHKITGNLPQKYRQIRP
jgi:AraC-like DNA-binding protein